MDKMLILEVVFGFTVFSLPCPTGSNGGSLPERIHFITFSYLKDLILRFVLLVLLQTLVESKRNPLKGDE